MRSYRPRKDITPMNYEKPKENILVLMPTYKWIPTETFSSFWKLLWYLLSNYSVTMQFVENTLIGHARDELVNKTLNIMKEKPIDYVLWCDSDHIFKPDDFESLRNTMIKFKLPMIGGLYFSRRIDKIKPIIYYKDEESLMYNPILEFPDNTALKVDATGFGMMLMKPEVIKKVQKKYNAPFTQDNVRNIGEDMLFLERAKEVGYDCYVHTGVVVRHYGGSVGKEEYDLHKKVKVNES